MREDLLPVTLEGKLWRFIEEVGEALKALGKLQRFGERARDPKTGIEYDNLGDMLSEMEHVDHAIREIRHHLEENKKRKSGTA